MLEIHYGRERLNKEKFIFDQVRDASGKILLIVPDQYTLQAERDAFFYLNTNVLMDLEVLGISRLGGRILREAGGGKRRMINRLGRHMLLAMIMEELGPDLLFFRNRPDNNAFLEMANDFISGLKQYAVGPDALDRIVSELPEGGILARKLADVGKIYRKYEEGIQGKFTDTEDYMDLFISRAPQAESIRESDIWIYGFENFTPKNLRLIESIARTARSVHLVLAWDRGGPDEDLFRLTGHIMQKLPADRISQIGDEYREPRPAALRHLESQIFAFPEESCNETFGITLMEAANIYSEGESAAAHVLGLVREEGLAFRDILLICNDLDTRGGIYQRVFAEYGMDLFLDAKRPLTHHPLPGYVLSILSILGKQYRTEDVMRMLKSGFGPLAPWEAEILENYAIRYKIRGSRWKQPFEKGFADRQLGRDDAERASSMTRLEELRRRAIGPVLALGEALRKAGTGRGKAECLYRHLAGPGDIPPKITSLMKDQETRGDLEGAQISGQLWDVTMDILDQVVEILGEERLPMERFFQLVQAGYDAVEIGLLPPAMDGLLLGTMQRTRSGPVKALMVLGANEGILPADTSGGSLLSPDETEALENAGISLGKTGNIRDMEESLAIYRNLSKATMSLWVSCAASNEKGERIRPSGIFDKIRSIFPEVPARRDILSQGNPEDLVQARDATLRHLTAALRAAKGGAPLTPPWPEVLAWYEENEPALLAKIRQGLAFDGRQKPVSRETADSLFKRQGEDLSLSPSRLERFGRCPFAHFVRYGMRPEDNRPYEVGPLEMGDIYHRCLMTVSGRLSQKTEGAPGWEDATRDDTDRLVRHFMESEEAIFGEGILQTSGEQKYRAARMEGVCRQASWHMVEHVRKGKVLGMRFEEEFSRNADLRPIEIRAGGERVVIEGKIDRVDLLPGEKVKIIDYKSGTDAFSTREALSGWKLQLMVYLKAALEEGKREPAGVFYFHVAEPRIDAASISRENPEAFRARIEEEIRKTFRMDGLMVDEPDVVESISGGDPLVAAATPGKGLVSRAEFDALLEQVEGKINEMCQRLVSGDISIFPMKMREETACKFCDYKSICMFDIQLEGCYYNLA